MCVCYVCTDSVCSPCCVISRKYGWNPNQKIINWLKARVKEKMGKEDCTFLEVRPRERFVFGRRCSSDDDNNDEEEEEKDDDDNYDDDDDDNDSNSAFYPSGVPK